MKIIISIISAIFFAAAGYFFFFKDTVDRKSPVSVSYVEVKKGPFVVSITTTGKIVSRRKEIVKSTGAGIILDAGFQNKTYVKKGTVIAKLRLEQKELQKKQQQLKLAEIDLQILREQLEQAQELFTAKAISERELKELQIREYKQQVSVKDIKEESADKSIEASFNGMIVNKKFNHLDHVYDDMELFTLIDANDIYIELPIFQQDITKVHLGQTVILTCDTFKGSREGEITEISNMASNPDSRNYRQNRMAAFNIYSTINSLPGDQVLFGSHVDAEIVLEKKENILSIPLEAILYRNNKKIVYIIEDGEAIQKTVETGDYNESFIEINSGLIGGEKVIIRGNLDVEDGEEVLLEGIFPEKI